MLKKKKNKEERHTKKLIKLDFDLDGGPGISISAEGASVVAEDAKTVVVTAEAVPFRVNFEGFDARRDLVVEARRLSR